MPQPVKACAGTLSEQTIAELQHGGSRAQWLTYACELCGQQVGPRLEKGRWVPEQHWPSIQYPVRTRQISKRGATPPVPAANSSTQSESR